MDTNEILSRLAQSFRDVFDEADLEITANLASDDLDAWDSLGHIRLMFTVEENFGIKFTMEEIALIDTAGLLAEMIAAKTKGR